MLKIPERAGKKIALARGEMLLVVEVEGCEARRVLLKLSAKLKLPDLKAVVLTFAMLLPMISRSLLNVCRPLTPEEREPMSAMVGGGFDC